MTAPQSPAPSHESPGMRLTLFDLVAAIDEASENEEESRATLQHMIECGHVRFDTSQLDELLLVTH